MANDLGMTSTRLWVMATRLPFEEGDGPEPHFLTRLHSMLLVFCVYFSMYILLVDYLL